MIRHCLTKHTIQIVCFHVKAYLATMQNQLQTQGAYNTRKALWRGDLTRGEMTRGEATHGEVTHGEMTGSKLGLHTGLVLVTLG